MLQTTLIPIIHGTDGVLCAMLLHFGLICMCNFLEHITVICVILSFMNIPIAETYYDQDKNIRTLFDMYAE